MKSGVPIGLPFTHFVSNPSSGMLIERKLQQVGETPDPFKRRRHADQSVVSAGEMRAHAAVQPFSRRRREAPAPD